MIVSVYIGDEAGRTSGTRCESSLILSSETTVRVLNGCTGRHLSVITRDKTSLSLCRVRAYGVCSGELVFCIAMELKQDLQHCTLTNAEIS